MKRLFSSLITILIVSLFAISLTQPAKASTGITQNMAGSIGLAITGFQANPDNIDEECGVLASGAMTAQENFMAGRCDSEGNLAGLLPTGEKYIAMLYNQQPSGREYIADILDNVGIPQVSSAYAQGTGYTALSSFLPFWKTFRNLAYSLYIIMFVVVGVMIMLRTKVNAQTVITIQSALPNLLITLLLITFSYAIVGFMIDLMYFLIYILVYLLSAAGIISTPTQAISRLLSYNAWSIIFEGRNSIIGAVAAAMRQILGGISNFTAGGRWVGGILTLGVTEILANGFSYLIVAVWLGFAMLKLIYVLLKSYVMLLVQTITAPVQLLMNAMPGSQAFSNWLKKTASYLIPFPVAGAMFIMAAVFIGNPTDYLAVHDWWGEPNPFGINENHEFYQNWESNDIWLPPFTLTGDNHWNTQDLMVIIGFFIFTMTPATVKMAQEWMQVKESPYVSEAFAGVGVATGLAKYPMSLYRNIKHQKEQRDIARDQSRWMAEEFKKIQGS